jgi:hypothetical protein
MHKEFGKAAGNAGLNHGLDLVVGAIGKVGDGPAGIDQDLVVERVDEFRQNTESRGNLILALVAVIL